MAPETPDRADVDRIVGCHLVKIMPGGKAAFLQNVGHVKVGRRIADRHRDVPFARLRCAHELRDAALDVGDRAYPAERWEHEFEPLAIHVGMAVDQSRNDCAAPEVDYPRGRTGMAPDFGVSADRDEAVALDRDGLRDAEMFV